MSFDRAQDFVFKWEGGYCNDPGDPGGPTNFGVCLRFLKEQGLSVGDIDHDGDIDIHDIKALTKEQAKLIMRRAFWCKDFATMDYEHPLMTMVAYDTAVNMGLGYAKRLLQQAIGGLSVDGIWGPKTWAAIAKQQDFRCALRMIELRRDRYRYLADRNKNLKQFLKGWLNRANDLEKEISK